MSTTRGDVALTERNCVTRRIVADDFAWTARRSWTNGTSTCTDPAGWDLTLPGLTLGFEPVVDDQEMGDDASPYWEGATAVPGSVELVGYCRR